MCLPATWFLEVMTLCSLEWLLIWVDPVMLFNWPDQQKVFHTKCTWMTSHQSVVPLKFLQAYWYWEPLATISHLNTGSELVKVPIVLLFGVSIAQKCTFFFWGAIFFFWNGQNQKEKICTQKKKMHKKKKSAPKEKKCIFRLTGLRFEQGQSTYSCKCTV